jgi:hypothetical protein
MPAAVYNLQFIYINQQLTLNVTLVTLVTLLATPTSIAFKRSGKLQANCQFPAAVFVERCTGMLFFIPQNLADTGCNNANS